MFRLEPNVAIQIEKAAVASLEQYGQSWRLLDEAQLQKNRLENLEQLAEYEGIPVPVILEGEYGSEFMQLCVRLAVIQNILIGQSGYHDTAPRINPELTVVRSPKPQNTPK